MTSLTTIRTVAFWDEAVCVRCGEGYDEVPEIARCDCGGLIALSADVIEILEEVQDDEEE